MAGTPARRKLGSTRSGIDRRKKQVKPSLMAVDPKSGERNIPMYLRDSTQQLHPEQRQRQRRTGTKDRRATGPQRAITILEKIKLKSGEIFNFKEHGQVGVTYQDSLKLKFNPKRVRVYKKSGSDTYERIYIGANDLKATYKMLTEKKQNPQDFIYTFPEKREQ